MPPIPPRSLIVVLRSGAWLTSERLRVYPLLLGGALGVALFALVATSRHAIDAWGRPLGVDFSGIWVAGHAVLAGHAAQPYDNTLNAAAQAAAFGPSDSFLPWPYPPYVLALAALLATLPYLAALAVWQAATLFLYLRVAVAAAATRHARDLPRGGVFAVAAAFPAVAINLLHGQNGFLSAALLAGGALLLPRRPMPAGVLFGLLVYKPQFALAVPVALLAGRQWRAVAAAGCTVAVSTLATYVFFGPAPWHAFAANLAFTRHVVLEMGGLEPYKLQSAFAAVRLVGGSVALAYAAQAVMGMAVLAGVAALWRGAVDARLKLAGLILASLLATPYAVDYDMAMLGPALAALAAYGFDYGFQSWGKTLLAIAWLMPLGARIVSLETSLPVGVAVMAVLFAHVLRWAGFRPSRLGASPAPEVGS